MVGRRLAWLALLLPWAAHAQGPTELSPPSVPEAPAASRSQSIGRATSGRLRNGEHLSTGANVLERGNQTYGTQELVQMIQRAAAAVRAELPGPRLCVGDLSAAHGGRIRPHRSHRSGRDADVGFFLHTEAGEPVESPAFISLGRDGCGDYQGQRYCWDHARNWALIVALATDREAQLQYIFVARDLRERLMAEGLRQSASPEIMHRVDVLTEPRTGSGAHRSHFHVRIYCPLDDRPGCIDEAPIHDWVVHPPIARAPARAPHRRVRHAPVRRRRS